MVWVINSLNGASDVDIYNIFILFNPSDWPSFDGLLYLLINLSVILKSIWYTVRVSL